MEGPKSSTAAAGATVVGTVLSHHGVVGMKWGHRRGSSGSSTKTSSEAPTHASADHIQTEAHKSVAKQHGIKALSNEHLQQVNTRMNLEQQYRNLAGNKPSKFETGHHHVKKVLAVAKTVNDIHNTINGPVGKAVKTAVKAKTASE